MKYYARQALKSMPFDVVSDSSGSFCLVYIDNKESRFNQPLRYSFDFEWDFITGLPVGAP